MALTSLTITYTGNDIWTLTDNDGNVRSEAFYSGGVINDYVIFKSKTGGNTFNLVPYSIINYVDETDSGNNFEPTSAIQLLTYLKGVGFFDSSIGGGGGVDTLLELLDVATPNYIGKQGYVLSVDTNEMTVSFKPVTGLDQDNQDIKHYFNYSDTDTEAQILAKINAIHLDFSIGEFLQYYPYTINEKQSVWFVGTGGTRANPSTLVYKMMNKGKGTYGNIGTGVGEAGTALVADDILLIRNSPATLADIINDPNTVVIDFGALTDPDTVSEWLNEQSTPIVIQAQTDGYTLFQGTLDGVELSYLWTGEAGTYGLAEEQSVMADFSLFDTGMPAPFIPASVPVEMFGAVGNGVADDWQAIQDALDSGYGRVVSDKEYRISRPLIKTNDKVFENNGNIKLIDGFVRDLTGDVAIGSNIVPVADADTYFSVGQQVCLSDDNRPVQGGATGQTRRTGASFFVTAVDSTTVTLDNNVTYNFTTSANAKIGHCQSCLIIEDALFFKVTGVGTFDANKENQFDVEALMYNATSEDTRFGCAISIQYSDNVFVEDVTVKNGVLHNLNLHHVNYVNVDGIRSEGAHDKNILLWDVHNFKLTNIYSLNPVYEDCIILHSDCSKGTISDCTLEGGARLGLGISTNGFDIEVSNIVAIDCARTISLVSAKRIGISNLKTQGGGQQPFNLFNRPMLYLENVESVTLDGIQIDSPDYAVAGIEIGGTSNKVSVKARISDMSDSANVTTGIRLTTISGNQPQNILIHNSIITNSDTGLSLVAGCQNIMVTDSYFDNTVNLSNLAGDELFALGNIGIDDNPLHDLQHTTDNGNVTSNDLQILKESGTARMWVQSETGLASLRLHSGVGDPADEAAAIYQNTAGDLVISNANPESYLDLDVTPADGNTHSGIRIIPGAIANKAIYRLNAKVDLITDLVTVLREYKFQDKSGTFAHLDDIPSFINYPETAFTETLFWTGTPPSGTPTVSSWTAEQHGKTVTVWMTVNYPTPGATNTNVSFSLPTGLPAPFIFTGADGTDNQIQAGGSGGMLTGINAALTQAARVTLRKISSAIVVDVRQASTAATGFVISFTYKSV